MSAVVSLTLAGAYERMSRRTYLTHCSYYFCIFHSASFPLCSPFTSAHSSFLLTALWYPSCPHGLLLSDNGSVILLHVFGTICPLMSYLLIV